MRTLRIAIPTFPIQVDYLGSRDYTRMVLNTDYSRSIQEAGAAVYPLPFSENTPFLAEQLSFMDGLVLPGGDDLDPIYYAAEPTFTRTVNPLRDTFEWQLLMLARGLQMPVLGICRGMQLLNVYYGGNLYQDIHKETSTAQKHQQELPVQFPSHMIDVEKDSKLYQALSAEAIRVNSFHHQAVKKLAPSFKVSARARDGIIEAFESVQGTAIFGIQWHPEMMSRNDEASQKIFAFFLEEVRQNISDS